MNMMIQQVSQEINQTHGKTGVSVEGKIEELTKSVSEVYKYELLTTNQYLKQMKLVIEIFNELTDTLIQQ